MHFVHLGQICERMVCVVHHEWSMVLSPTLIRGIDAQPLDAALHGITLDDLVKVTIGRTRAGTAFVRGMSLMMYLHACGQGTVEACRVTQR